MKNELRERKYDLYKAIAQLKNEEECIAFFEDLCSISELYSIEQRFEVAKMLYKDNVYTEITKQTNASTATISRVKRMLSYDGNGAVLKAVENLED